MSRLVILGGGPAGYVGAIRAAQLGAQVTLVEEDALGGTCLNRGCIPTKALLKRTDVWTLLQHLGDYGCKAEGISFDWQAMQKQKQQAVHTLRMGVENLLKTNKVTLIRGRGRLTTKNRVEVETKGGTLPVEADRIIIATGSEPIRIPLPGAEQPHVLDSTGLLELSHVPKTLAIIGGGVIGCEFASLFSRLGSKVSIVELEDQLLPGTDQDIADLLAARLTRSGVAIHTGSKAVAIGKDTLKVESSDQTFALEAEIVLLSVGRRPRGADLGLETLGVDVERGAVKVNEYMETSVPGIYAAGDVTGGWQLAHVASREAIVAVENALGHRVKMDYKAVPACIYTEPEIASVGMTESQAKRARGSIKVSRFPFSANGRALSSNENDGFVKIIADGEVNEILGLHIVGSHATELIAEGTLAISMEATADELINTIHAHPTLAEAIMEAAHGLTDGAIHLPPVR